MEILYKQDFHLSYLPGEYVIFMIAYLQNFFFEVMKRNENIKSKKFVAISTYVILR